MMGQTYSFTLTYTVPSQIYCWNGSYGWSIRGDNKIITEKIKNKIHLVENTELEFLNVANYNNFKIAILSNCYNNNDQLIFNNDQTKTLSASLIIVDGTVTMYGYNNERLAIDGFKPNGIVISKPGYNLYPEGILTPPEFISGEEIDLIATPGTAPNKFPNEAYHWQYSLDNEQTWIDVPVIAGKTATNTPTPSFSIQDILGADHINHFGPIDFRIGYSNRPFTDTYRIIYSAGAPVLEKITYEGPQCANENIKTLTVFFDRDLYDNEDLAPLYVQKKSLTVITPLQQQPVVKDLTLDTETGFYKYSFVNLTKLEDNEEYEIKYQARFNEQPRGTLKSSYPEIFMYKEPKVLIFDVTNNQKPTCNGGNDGYVEITITSGTNPYHFYQDNEEVPAELINGKYYIKNLEAKNYSFMVKDVNCCIDKSKND